MTYKADEMLERKLKKAGELLSRPSNLVDKLLRRLHKVEKLLLKVDRSPKESMLKALKPSMNMLIHDRLLKHSDVDVKVAVASCITQITRITTLDAPYTDNQMKDIFRLIVSSFENLDDQSSRSYHKRASILETVSTIELCFIMVDLECDELIVKMFEHFLKSVRDYHPESIFSSMENIMVLVIVESKEVSDELLKLLLARVRKNREGVLPVAHKLAKQVLLRSADELKPYMIPALTSLGESLDMYHEVVAAVCEGITANFLNNDDNDSGLQLANECKLQKGSVDEVAKEDHPVENKSPKSVMEGASVEKTEKEKSQPIIIEGADDSHADKLVKEKSEAEKTSKRSEKKADNVVNELENQNLKDNDVKKPENQNEEYDDVTEIENVSQLLLHMSKSFHQKEMESKPNVTANVSSPSQSNNGLDESSVSAKQKPVPQEDETASQSKSGPLTGETHVKKVGLPKNKGSTQEDTPESQNQAGKKTILSKEVRHPNTVKRSKAGVVSSVPDANLLKGSSESTKLKLLDIMNYFEAQHLKMCSESTKHSGNILKQPGKKLDVGESDAKKGKHNDAKVDVRGEDANSLKMSVKKGEKSKIAVEEEKEFKSDSKAVKSSATKNISNTIDEGKKRGNGNDVAEKDQAKSLSRDDEADISPKSATKSAKGEGNSTKTPVTSAKRKHDTGKDEVSIKYDESLVGTKVKVWWPENKVYYEGVVEKYYPDKKKHKISYVDGDTEVLRLNRQKWEILPEFSVPDYKGQNINAQIEEASTKMVDSLAATT